jgi:hypothetical protein
MHIFIAIFLPTSFDARPPRGDLAIFRYVCLIWELPPSISLRVTRKPGFTGRCQRFKGKGLVVAKEGISTPSAPYLR